MTNRERFVSRWHPCVPVRVFESGWYRRTAQDHLWCAKRAANPTTARMLRRAARQFFRKSGWSLPRSAVHNGRKPTARRRHR